MKFKDRLIIFGFGLILGAILVTVIKSQQKRDRKQESPEPTTVVEIQRAAAPGIIQAYEERRVPMQSDYVTGTQLYSLPEPNQFRRVLILQGQAEEQTVRIEEYITRRGQEEVLNRVRVTSPDRLTVKVVPPTSSAQLADEIRPLGYRVVELGTMPNEFIVFLGAKKPETVDAAIEQIGAMEIVDNVQPLYYGASKL